MTQQLHHLIERLSEAEIDFVIVGGFAGMLHGSSLLAAQELRAIIEHKKQS